MIKYGFTVLLLVLSCFMQIGFAQSIDGNNGKMMLIYVGTDYYNPQTMTGGEVTHNQYIKDHVANTDISNSVCRLAKFGTPMIILGNGSSPKVMITAGVHGNEIPAQLAAMELINYLKGREINGTVYVVPFVSPNGTSQTLRYWNHQNLNSNANKEGTPSNAVILACKQLGIERLGDFHSTQPGGYPGNYSVLCSKSPEYESYVMAEYISSYSNSSLITYDLAGVDYEGAVEDVSNIQGIPAVTCEVLSPQGVATEETVHRSFDQMIKFLEYCKIV
ncbi:Succinylglutamate desuccinylase/aspartoacylase [Methanobacterium lacus]|uniref:Succinylglutamate desuccinylase/aspartoacylase n=1 Tax=Methanobacterium lacus (strain AL-21) TaxID=877455 RepID=F0T903_METLA